MSERSEQQPKTIEEAKIAVSARFAGIKAEINHELKELKTGPKAVRPHNGKIIRPDAEIHHQETRLRDYQIMKEFFLSLLESLEEHSSKSE